MQNVVKFSFLMSREGDFSLCFILIPIGLNVTVYYKRVYVPVHAIITTVG